MTIITGLIGLGIVIFVHETGHFIAAKISGIEVEAYSLGWGQPFFRYFFRGTEYRLSILPFGGYCKLKGEEPFSNPGEKNSDPEANAGSIFSVSPLKRIFTFAAGPFSNLIFSILILSIIWMAGFSVSTYENRIALISDYSYFGSSDQTYPADAAGLKTGDRIVAIDSVPVTHYRDIQELIATRPDVPVVLKIERNGELFTKTLIPALNKDTGTGMIGVSAWVSPVVGHVEPGSAAAAAGIQPGDRILTVDNTPIYNHLDFLTALRNHPLRFGFTLDRNGTTISLRMVPEYDENGHPVIGLSFAGLVIDEKAANPIQALVKGTTETFSTLSLSVKSLTLLFHGINLNKAVSGPLRITYMVGQVASYGFSQGIKTGLISLFRFLSFLSVALFVMNLLPIPALDGGLILLNIFEILIRRRVSGKFYYRYQVLGFAFIITLLVLTTFSDIFYFFTN